MLVTATARSSTAAIVLSVVVLVMGSAAAYWIEHKMEQAEREHAVRRRGARAQLRAAQCAFRLQR